MRAVSQRKDGTRATHKCFAVIGKSVFLGNYEAITRTFPKILLTCIDFARDVENYFIFTGLGFFL